MPSIYLYWKLKCKRGLSFIRKLPGGGDPQLFERFLKNKLARVVTCNNADSKKMLGLFGASHPNRNVLNLPDYSRRTGMLYYPDLLRAESS